MVFAAVEAVVRLPRWVDSRQAECKAFETDLVVAPQQAGIEMVAVELMVLSRVVQTVPLLSEMAAKANNRAVLLPVVVVEIQAVLQPSVCSEVAVVPRTTLDQQQAAVAVVLISHPFLVPLWPH